MDKITVEYNRDLNKWRVCLWVGNVDVLSGYTDNPGEESIRFIERYYKIDNRRQLQNKISRRNLQIKNLKKQIENLKAGVNKYEDYLVGKGLSVEFEEFLNLRYVLPEEEGYSKD